MWSASTMDLPMTRDRTRRARKLRRRATPASSTRAAPVSSTKYEGNFGPVSMSGGTGYPLYDLSGLLTPAIDPGSAPKEPAPVIPGFKYEGNFGPVPSSGGTGYPLSDVPGLMTPTHDPGPAGPKEGDSVNPESAFKYDFKYDSSQPGYAPYPPIYKAFPYDTGPAPKKADPGKPSEEQP